MKQLGSFWASKALHPMRQVTASTHLLLILLCSVCIIVPCLYVLLDHAYCYELIFKERYKMHLNHEVNFKVKLTYYYYHCCLHFCLEDLTCLNFRKISFPKIGDLWRDCPWLLIKLKFSDRNCWLELMMRYYKCENLKQNFWWNC